MYFFNQIESTYLKVIGCPSDRDHKAKRFTVHSAKKKFKLKEQNIKEISCKATWKDYE